MPDRPDCLYNGMMRSVDEGTAVHVINLDFSKAFDTIFHSVIIFRIR